MKKLCFLQALRLRTVTLVLIPEEFPDWKAVITFLEDKYGKFTKYNVSYLI